MHAVSTLTAIGTALCLAASSAHAVGFGRISNATQLGQPLNFAAAVRLEPDELLPRECVSAEVQSGDNRLQPGQVRVTLEGPVDSLDRSVRVTTSTLIDEPVVTVSVTLGCTAKVTRRFVAFVDPPLINAAQTVPVDVLPPQRFDSPVAPIVTMVQGASAAGSVPRRARSVPPRDRSTTQALASDASGVAPEPLPARADKAKRTSPLPRQPRAARAAASGSRLQLDAAAPVVARSAPAAASAAPAPLVVPPVSEPVLAAGSAASAARPDEPAGLAAKEGQRIQSLEDGLAKLRRDSQATQASVAALQARLQAAESERYANPVVYALAWLSALLALAVAGLWWRQARARQSSQWWAGPAPAPAASSARLAGVAAEAVASAPQPLGAPHTAASAFEVSTMIEEDQAPRRSHPPSPPRSWRPEWHMRTRGHRPPKSRPASCRSRN